MAKLLEYVWIDAEGGLRSKTKVHYGPTESPDQLPDWNYDGSSTKQATGWNSDVLIKPVAVFKDPFLGDPHKLVMCDSYNRDGTPHRDNHRVKCLETMTAAKNEKPWFGIEQEYILFGRDNLPFGWKGHNEPGCGPQAESKYYCGAGGDRVFGRELASRHLLLCLEAGLKMSGKNAEVMASQWEFQVGPCEGVEIGDHLWMARYILLRVAEEFSVEVSLHPKPYKGDWNGSGGHTNFSTYKMRHGFEYEPGKPNADVDPDAVDKDSVVVAEAKESDPEDMKEFHGTGMYHILDACHKMAAVHKDHMAVYGKHNEERMTGAHETASMDDFSYGYSDRGKSIRIPLLVKAKKKGYLEDRRPASNLDPYLVSERMVRTICL